MDGGSPASSEDSQEIPSHYEDSEIKTEIVVVDHELEPDPSFNSVPDLDAAAIAKDILKNRTTLFPRSRGPRTEQQTAEKIYECEECGKCFTRSFTLKEHRRVHTGERPFPCTECGKTFMSNGDLTKHQKIHSGEKKHLCPICGKAFTMGGDLVKHIKIHTGEKDYECSVCSKRFTKNGNLKQHMRSHSGERPYTCAECGVSFTQSYHLKRHMVRHTGVGGKFKCQECGKSFPENGYLRRHFRVHSGEKPYKCSICDRGFAQKGALQKHISLHEKSKGQVTCSTCGITFPDKSLLYIHKMTVHLGKKPTPTVESENRVALSNSLCRKNVESILNCFKSLEGMTEVSKVVAPEPECCLDVMDHSIFIKDSHSDNEGEGSD